MSAKSSPENTIARARELRHDPTPAEKLVWERIRNSQLGVRFRRQAPLGPYFADFLCEKAMLIVEIDGEDHATSKTDAARTRYLEGLGFKVIRFWNSDVTASIEGVVLEIEKAVAARRVQKI